VIKRRCAVSHDDGHLTSLSTPTRRPNPGILLLAAVTASAMIGLVRSNCRAVPASLGRNQNACGNDTLPSFPQPLQVW
jgi:hypothetical protein